MEQTFVTTLGLTITGVIAILVLTVPSRLAILPLIIAECYLTLGQSVYIGSVNFTVFRIILVFCWLRLFLRGEWRGLKLNSIDEAILWWSLSSVVTYTLLWQTSFALINRLGLIYDALGFYFFFRFILNDCDYNQVLNIFKRSMIIIIPLALFVLYENSTGRNLFAAMGGVPAISELREGSFRSQGAFRHPILAGTFGATLLPLGLLIWYENKTKIFTIIGVLSCLIIVWSSQSSGPLLAATAGIGALLMWPLRDQMKIIRWCGVLSLLGLHLVMKAPVWFLPARVADVIGGSGWYRSYLIDRAIYYFDEWWLIGTKNTAHWMPFSLYIDPTKADITNQYIGQGINGGLITMLLFIIIIVFSFKEIGFCISLVDTTKVFEKMFIWSIGAALFSHAVSFLSVAYFDQIIISWYLTLALISSMRGILSRSGPSENTFNDSVMLNIYLDDSSKVRERSEFK